MPDPTTSLINEINAFIRSNGYQQHTYVSDICAGNSYYTSVFWQYLREETLNRRIVEDGYR